jgi:hypothetical protein
MRASRDDCALSLVLYSQKPWRQVPVAQGLAVEQGAQPAGVVLVIAASKAQEQVSDGVYGFIRPPSVERCTYIAQVGMTPAVPSSATWSKFALVFVPLNQPTRSLACVLWGVLTMKCS